MNSSSVMTKGITGFEKVVKYVMPEINSIDIDNMIDWKLCEILIEEMK